MSVSESPNGLRPLVLPRRTIFSPKNDGCYRPRIFRGNPSDYYQHTFSAKLDRMVSIQVRINRACSTPIRSSTGNDGTLYGIRKYRVKAKGGSPHPIEDLMRKFQNCKLTQQLRYLLMPTHSYLHVDEKSFYTVSESDLTTLSSVLQGLKDTPSMMCHDDIWSIVNQVIMIKPSFQMLF